MKLLALDLGDRWIGTALTDNSQILARPYQTVELKDLIPFLQNLFATEKIQTIIVGKPSTFRGTESEQTKKIIAHKEALETQFPSHTWIFWEERLTSKHAQKLTNKDKKDTHSVAAALILDSYLTYLRFQSSLLESF